MSKRKSAAGAPSPPRLDGGAVQRDVLLRTVAWRQRLTSPLSGLSTRVFECIEPLKAMRTSGEMRG